MTSSRYRAGQIIADRFALESLIGTGGMGDVWRAEHTRLRSPVAVKLLHDAVAEHEEAVPRFLREAQACAAIRGPNVVQVLDFGVDEGTPYIAMELLEGESLRERLAREGRLTPDATQRVIGQVGKAIGRAHKLGIVHRDLKPANIHLCPDDDGEVAKVLDFGLAKLLEGTSLAGAPITVTGAIMGTASYMSPEQARGRTDLDHRADLWSLAIIAFQCLAGRLPLTGRNQADLILAICTEPLPVPSAVAKHVPPAFDAWFARGTKRSPDDRFQSAAEMTDALTAALGAKR